MSSKLDRAIRLHEALQKAAPQDEADARQELSIALVCLSDDETLEYTRRTRDH